MNESLPEVNDASAAPAEDEGATSEGSSQIAPSPPRRRHYRRRRRSGLLSLAVVFVVAALVAIVLRLFVVQTFFVPSGSMIPTLDIYDRMLVLKIGYTVGRGNIMVFRQPPNDTADPNHEDLVKRVIGLPGETIWSKGNTVFINGEPLAEPWLAAGTYLGQPISRQTIPAGDYFMMGDNRSDSDDSRDWGPLPGSYFIGRVLVVIWRHGHPVFHIQ
ncbi:MAG: signal peptidase I [Acidimicrobiales bacterium]|jgi:signal peptidase I